jgi:hypothetical protein
MDDHSRVVSKIIKRLQSPDDNDKLASLLYITKVFPSPSDLTRSPFSQQICSSLRSTQFLERALHSPDCRPLIFSILSVFSRIFPSHDLLPFVPLLLPLLPDDFSSEPTSTLIEIASSLEDISVFFESFTPSQNSLAFLTKVVSAGTSLSLTPAVFRARSIIFSFLTGRELLSVREEAFRLISALIRLNDSIAIYRSQNTLDLTDFLAAEHLALIELRLQLDIPRDYREIEGSLVNLALSAASCELLELLIVPLLNHELEMSDSGIEYYFENLNVIVHDSFQILREVKGKRDCGRNEVKCLLVIVAKWLMEAPFLCTNEDVIGSIGPLVRLLEWFPEEAVHFLPGFTELVGHADTFREAGVRTLAQKMIEFGNDEERCLIEWFIQAIYPDVTSPSH